ncbi:dTMP kinase [Streptomyces sp. NPDC001089]
MTGFWTLLGPDFSGKSTVLNRLHTEHDWHVVSYDDRYLESAPLIRRLREMWIADAFAWSGRRYTPELVLAVLHPIVLHLRDELARAADLERVVVDSYYYKLLSKCALLGLEDSEMFAAWRSFPQPEGVIYLDVSPETAWQRSERGVRINPFEHFGARPTRDGFLRLQGELRGALLKEASELPLTVLDADAPPRTVLDQVLAALGTRAER